jgi:hypothetical protein
MKNQKISTFRSLIAPSLGLAALLLPGLARAAEEPGWSLNFTPVATASRSAWKPRSSSFMARSLDSPRSGP